MALHIQKDGQPFFIYKNKPIDWSDAFVFTRLRSSDQHFCGSIYDYLRHHHIPVNDPINHSYVHSAEKISQMLMLTLAGIRVPETIIFREESFAKNRAYIEEHLTFPLIYKTDGSQGRNVHFVKTIEELDALISKKRERVLALVQPFIENTFDTRTITAFGEVLGSIKRERNSGYLNNVAQGATVSAYNLNDTEKDIALRSAKACGIDLAGVDIIHTETGPVVIEVNKSPQVTGFESVHGFKVFEKIAGMLREKYTVT
jgi:ribosomal protein S6--L-glutamate ligase